MRLRELTFERVGEWKGLPPLEIGPKVTIVLGDNEAGKSTAMRAVEALLFGTTRALVAPLASESLFAAAARATLADGTEARFERRGRRLVSASADALAPILEPSNAARFRDLFRIDHVNVRAGAGFLAEDGALGRVLLAAGAGASAAEIARIEKSIRERLAVARTGKKGSDGLQIRLEAYRAAKAELAKRPLFGAYDSLADEVARLVDGERVATAEIAELDGQIQRLGALIAGLADDRALEEHQSALAAIEADGPTPRPDWPARIAALATRVAEADAALAEAKEAAALAAAALEETPPPAPIVAFAAEIGEVEREAALLDAERAELDARRGAVGERRSKLAALVTALGAVAESDGLVAAGEALLLAAPRQRALTEAIGRGDKLDAAEQDAKERVIEARRALEQARGAALGAPARPTVALEAGLRAVGELETLASREAEAREVARAQGGRAESLAAKLGLATTDPDALAAVPVAGWGAVEEAWTRLEATRAAASTTTRERSAFAMRVDEATAALDQLRAGTSAPSREELDRARREREEALGALKAVWSPVLRAAAERELPGLTSHLERKVAAADDVADRRFDDAERIGRWEAARESVRRLREELERASNREHEAARERDAAEQAFAALFPFLPAAPRDPTGWLHEHQAMLEALHAARDAEQRGEACSAERAQLRRDLAALVGEDQPSIAALECAATLRSELEREIGERRAQNEEASARAADVRTAASALEAAERASEKAAAALSAWRREWSALLEDFPPSVGVDRVAVREWVARQESLERAVSDVRALDGEIDRRAEILAAREERARALFARVSEVEPSLTALEQLGARDKVRELGARARAEVERRRAHDAAASTDEAARKQLRQATTTATRRREELSALWREAELPGDPDPDGIERASRRATEAHEHRIALERLEAVLAKVWRTDAGARREEGSPRGHGDLATTSRTVEAARGEIAGRSADELEAARKERVTRREAIAERRDGLIGERARKEADLASLGASPDQADAALGLALARGRVFERADEVVELEVAAWLLAKAKEQAAEGARPIVDRASSFFAALTDGGYEGLVIARDGAEPSLLALSKDGRAKTAAELSDGTCDAIWLALRLAVVAESAREAPLPLLLDEVFVHLDDRRTTALLRVLASLSEDVQVLAFTHHDHVVDLARAAIADALEVVVLATPEGSPRVRTLGESRARHERPTAPQAAFAEAELVDPTSHEEAVDAVLVVLRAGEAPMGKAEIVEAARTRGVDLEGVWTAVLARLKEEGRIVQTGERRGARYALAAPDAGGDA